MRRAFYVFVIAFIFIITQPSAFAQNSGGKVVVRGAESMLVVAQRLGQNAGVAVDVNVSSSGVATAGLHDGRVGVVQRLGTSVSRSGDEVDIPIGVAAVVIYVHASNRVKALSVAELNKIYSGEVTNWKQVGGADAPIHLISSETALGGGASFFRDVVLNGSDFSDVMRGFGAATQMLTTVASDPAAIGFGPLFHAPAGVRAVAISKVAGGASVEPTDNSIRALRYPLSRLLIWKIRKESDPAVKKLCRWALGNAGQRALMAQDYFQLEDLTAAAANNLLGSQGN